MNKKLKEIYYCNNNKITIILKRVKYKYELIDSTNQ